MTKNLNLWIFDENLKNFDIEKFEIYQKKKLKLKSKHFKGQELKLIGQKNLKFKAN